MKKIIVFMALTIIILGLFLVPLFKNQTYIHILIDAGHGDNDPGTTSLTGKYEKDINLEIANELKRRLWFDGYKVDLTRSSDEFISLANRADLANDLGVDLFLSIHCNAIENKPDIDGVQILYYPDELGENQEGAGILMNHILHSTKATNRGCIPRENLVVLRDTRMKSFLIESGFLTNEKEAFLLEDKAYQDKLIKGIIGGIEEMLKMNLLTEDIRE